MVFPSSGYGRGGYSGYGSYQGYGYSGQQQQYGNYGGVSVCSVVITRDGILVPFVSTSFCVLSGDHKAWNIGTIYVN